MKERSDLMGLFLKHGIGSLSDMKHIYDGLQDTVDKVNRSDADFVQRLKDPDRKYIKDWADSNSIATHKLGVEYDNEGNPVIYPNVQNIDGRLVDFTRPPYHSWAGFDSAVERGDTVRVNSIGEGVDFTRNYKNYYPKGHTFKVGGLLHKYPDGGELEPAVVTAEYPRNRGVLDVVNSSDIDSYPLLSYSSEFPVEMYQVPEEPEVPKGKYKVLDDPAEQTFIRKANEIIDEDKRSTTKKQAQGQLRAMSKDQLMEQQRKLADLGFYDVPLSTGRSNIGSEVQDILIRKGYLDRSEKDGIVGRDTTTALQEMLVDEGYLPETTENGRTNIDGILGKRSQEAFKEFYRDYNVDGKLGGRTERAYIEYLGTSSNPFDKEVDAKGMVDQCAAWVSKKYDRTVGKTKQNGVYGNAWNMLKNIEDAGGQMIFNLYDAPEFEDITTPRQLNQRTQEALGNHSLDFSQLAPGDIVGIYIPSSPHMKDTIEGGTTYNTHVGMVVDIEDGVPVVEHNILGKVRRERIDKLTGALRGKPQVTVAARPKHSVAVADVLPFDTSIKSSLKMEVPVYDKNGNDTGRKREISNPQFNEYKDALASSKKMFKDIYPDVDSDFIEKAAISILGRETYFMEHKQSDYRKIDGNPGGVGSFLSAWLRRAGYRVKKVHPEKQSRDLTKMKFSSVPDMFRKAIGLETPEQLDNDPTVAGRAAYAILARNYDYFQRLAKEYPELGLTKTDIENATIQSYNTGMKSGMGYSLGFNKETGQLDMSEIELLRRRGTEGYKEIDPSSTNWPHVTDFGEDILEWGLEHFPSIPDNVGGVINPIAGFGMVVGAIGERGKKNIKPSTPYIGRARKYMKGISEK